jgi:hypothetical protein
MLNEMQMRKILNGSSPSSVFRELAVMDETLTTDRLAEMLIDEFPNLDGEVVVLVWNWTGLGRTNGLNDERLDGLLTDHFRRAGYTLKE